MTMTGHPVPPAADTAQGRSQTRLVVDVDHFAHRVLQDCLTQATAQHWLDRAAVFERAAPQPGDYVGSATPAQLAEATARCRESAAACRRRAELIISGSPEEISADVRDALREVA